jgi:hypothetical protein
VQPGLRFLLGVHRSTAILTVGSFQHALSRPLA